MGLKLMEFGMKLTTVPSGSKININPNVTGITAIKSEIGKIEKTDLKELMIKVRALLAGLKFKAVPEQKAISKEIFKSCFNAVGSEGLANIMRSNLIAVVEKQGNIPTDIQLIITELAQRFKEICMKQIQ